MKIIFYKELDSTSLEAKRLLSKKEAIQPFTIITAEKQTAGYGKIKRKWLSRKGGLYFSIILPHQKLEKLCYLIFAGSIAVLKTLKKYHLKADLKWPNDVLVFKKKIAGILVENVLKGKKVNVSIMGIGINTNIKNFPRGLKKIATSFKIEKKREIDNKKFLINLIENLKNILKQSEEKVFKEYKKYQVILGKKIKILFQGKKIEGKVIDINKKGALIIKPQKQKRYKVELLKIFDGDILLDKE